MDTDKENRESSITFLTILEIIRDKSLFVLIFSLLGMGVALIVSYILPPTYESSVNLEAGKVWGHLLEAPQEISETILSEPFLYKIIELNKLSITPRKLQNRIESNTTKDVQKRALTIIRLSARGGSPEESVQILNSIVTMIDGLHISMYEEWMALNHQYQQELKAKIDALEKEINEVRTLQLDRLKNPQGDPPILHLEGYLEDRETSYLDYVKEYHEVNSYNHSRFYSRKTQIRFPPPLPTEPIAPKKLLNSIAGFLVGFLISLAWCSYKKYTQ